MNSWFQEEIENWVEGGNQSFLLWWIHISSKHLNTPLTCATLLAYRLTVGDTVPDF